MSREKMQSLFDVSSKVAVWAILVIIGFVGRSVLENQSAIAAIDKRVASIEASRWTARDQSMFQHEQSKLVNDKFLVLQGQLSTIREEIAALPKKVPPDWFLKQVQQLEGRVDRLENKN